MSRVALQIRHIDAAVSPPDRGLAYGDGLFETISVRDGRAPLLSLHLARLRRDAARLGIPLGPEGPLDEALAAYLGSNRSGIIKLVLTRGPGGRGYRPPDSPRPCLQLAWYPPASPPAAGHPGLAVRLCRTCIGISPATAGMKHLNRLEQVLASAELVGDEFEGLMCDADDRLIEGTRTNLFLVLDDILVTPSLARSGVAGVMREWILRWCEAQGIAVRIADVPLAALGRATELLVCNSAIGVCPVVRVHGRAGWQGEPGQYGRRLMAALASAGLTA